VYTNKHKKVNEWDHIELNLLAVSVYMGEAMLAVSRRCLSEPIEKRGTMSDLKERDQI